MDDLRNFSPLPDPYKENPAVADYAYWIVPYLIDGSQQYEITDEQKNFLQKNNLLSDTISDVYTSPFGIILGEGNFETHKIENNVEIIFSDGRKVKLSPDEIILDSSDLAFTKPTDKAQDRHFKFTVQKENNNMNLGWQRENSFMNLFTLKKSEAGFSLRANKLKNISLLAPMFQPDRSDLPVDPLKSVFYWNNITAIAGRNPLRLFILPLNTLGRPIQTKEVKFASEKKEELNIVYPQDYSFRVSPWFVDITAEKALKSSLTINIDGAVIAKDIPIEFITDCRSHIKDCLQNPGELVNYLSYLIKEQLMTLSEDIRKSS